MHAAWNNAAGMSLLQTLMLVTVRLTHTRAEALYVAAEKDATKIRLRAVERVDKVVSSSGFFPREGNVSSLNVSSSERVFLRECLPPGAFLLASSPDSLRLLNRPLVSSHVSCLTLSAFPNAASADLRWTSTPTRWKSRTRMSCG
jgi:hypothetical protein